MNMSLAAGGLLVVALLWLAPPLAAQFTMVGKVKDFKVPDYYPAIPGVATNRLKTLLTGSNAQPQLGGLLLVNGLRIESFRETGPSESVILAPQCLFEMASRNASSTGRLEMFSSDGRFSIAGDGFLWRAANASLIISNRVRTFIRKDAVGEFDSAKPEPPPPVAPKP